MDAVTGSHSFLLPPDLGSRARLTLAARFETIRGRKWLLPHMNKETGNEEEMDLCEDSCRNAHMRGVSMIDVKPCKELKTLGVWAFHGAKDPVVPCEESQRMVTMFRKVGCPDVKFTVYPEADHDSWTETYCNPQLYEWFLKYSR